MNQIFSGHYKIVGTHHRQKLIFLGDDIYLWRARPSGGEELVLWKSSNDSKYLIGEGSFSLLSNPSQEGLYLRLESEKGEKFYYLPSGFPSDVGRRVLIQKSTSTRKHNQEVSRGNESRMYTHHQHGSEKALIKTTNKKAGPSFESDDVYSTQKRSFPQLPRVYDEDSRFYDEDIYNAERDDYGLED
jgi:hypothetical protein